jgi:hypothetical protein
VIDFWFSNRPTLARRSGRYAVLTVVNADGSTPGSSLLDEIVREGTRRMLAAAR